jgi:hypothetical protein
VLLRPGLALVRILVLRTNGCGPRERYRDRLVFLRRVREGAEMLRLMLGTIVLDERYDRRARSEMDTDGRESRRWMR